jgi:hypothetical protein
VCGGRGALWDWNSSWDRESFVSRGEKVGSAVCPLREKVVRVSADRGERGPGRWVNTRMRGRASAHPGFGSNVTVKKNRSTCMRIGRQQSISESQSSMRHSVGSARDKHSGSTRRRFRRGPLSCYSKPAVVGSTPGGKPESDSPESRSDECGQSLWAARAERSGARTPSLSASSDFACHRGHNPSSGK